MVVRVWVVRDGRAVAETAEEWLSPRERAQAAEWAVDDRRETFMVSRALQRALGARHLGVSVERVGISRACAHCPDPGHGKPHFADAPELDYSVSHTRGLIVLAASTGTRVGVDVESGSREIEPAGMTRLLASEPELRALSSTATALEPQALFRLWARKEAVVKLTGHGILQVPFTALSVDGPTARLDSPPPGWPEEPVHVTDLPLGDGVFAALATTCADPEVTVTELRRVADLAL